MTNTRVTLPALFVLGVCSCASAPTKPATAEAAAEQPSTSPAVASDENLPAPAAVSFTPSRKLGPGQCEECFDCVDTVGFPPPGHKWACVRDKCVKAKLTGFAGETSSASGDNSAEPEKPQASARKARKRRR
jgi:hypothetical protein